jgi:TonB family protein
MTGDEVIDREREELRADGTSTSPVCRYRTRSPPDRDARVVNVATPETPTIAQRQGITGEVAVRVDLDAAGDVIATTVTRTANPLLNAAAIAAARASTYAPAIAGCVAVSSSAEFRVAFSSGAPAAAAPAISLPAESGAPVRITNVSTYLRKTTRGTAVLSNEFLYCISFLAVASPVRSVTFELYHTRADGIVSSLTSLTRSGNFAPGTEIRSYQGEKVGGFAGGGDEHALANCVPFSPAFDMERFTVVRPIRAELADGSTWVSATAPAALPTPVAIIDTEDPPPWDAMHHAGYVAVASGGGTMFKPEPQKIVIYAPHRQRPSASIDIPRCCVGGYDFDGSGNLIAAGGAEGVLVFAPGATTVTRRFPDHPGYVIAVNARGDIAIGGVNRTPDTAVYPATGGAYRVAAAPSASGLALSDDGELAVIDQPSNTVRTYAPGSTVPGRTLIFSEQPGSAVAIGSIAYSRHGVLAVRSARDRVIRIYAPGATTPLRTIPAAGAQAFDADGELVAISPLQTEIVSPLPGVAPQMLAYGGSAVATERSGRGYAIRDAFRNQFTTYDADGTVTVVPLPFNGSGIAVSP